MSPINFVYWLQGFLEIGDPRSLTLFQIQEIRNHIALVLDKQTPSRDDKLCQSAEILSNANFSVQDTNRAMSSLNIGESGIIPRYGYITDMNGNPFPLDLLRFTHEGSC